MQLGSASSLTTTTIRGLSRWYAGVTDVNQFTDAQVDGLVNRYLHTMQVWILECYPAFQLSGTVAKSNLVAGTNNYAFATDYVEINRIEISYSGTENTWSEARLMDMRKVGYNLATQEDTSDRVTESSNPLVYIFNNRIYLKDPPASNVTNGLWVYYTPIQTELSGTTDEPIFPEHFHKGLSLGAALDYCVPKKPEKVAFLEKELLKVRAGINEYFAQTVNTSVPRITAHRQNYR